jgi:hypothetical protein
MQLAMTHSPIHPVWGQRLEIPSSDVRLKTWGRPAHQESASDLRIPSCRM